MPGARTTKCQVCGKTLRYKSTGKRVPKSRKPTVDENGTEATPMMLTKTAFCKDCGVSIHVWS